MPFSWSLPQSCTRGIELQVLTVFVQFAHSHAVGVLHVAGTAAVCDIEQALAGAVLRRRGVAQARPVSLRGRAH